MVMKLISLFLLCIWGFVCLGQDYYTKSRKAIKFYEKAVEDFQRYDYSQAADNLDNALHADNNFIEAHLLYAQLFVEKNLPKRAIEVYDKVVEIDSVYFPLVWWYRANTCMTVGDYAKALESYEVFSLYHKYSGKFKSQIDFQIERCNFALDAISHPVPFTPINMGQSVNTNMYEYAPALTVDAKTLIFTRLVPTPPNDDNLERFNEDFYVSKYLDNHWVAAQSMGAPINTVFNEGAPAISADGRIMAYISCVCRDGVQKCCDVYLSTKVGGKWLAAKNVGAPVNTAMWESQPSLSADGRTLYFVSNRKGGFGGKDIWVSHLGQDDNWSEPQNLGSKINTPQDEMSPFIHPDGQTLYFASDGHVGMGRKDLFFSRCDTANVWCKAVNLGYPINTHKDEGSLILNGHGDLAIFASEREGGFGGLDLYSFEMPQHLRPSRVDYIEGVVYDSISKKRLHADFELYNLKTGECVFQSTSDPVDGRFLVCLPVGFNYAFNVNKVGYLFFSEHFSLSDSNTLANLYLNIPLIPVGVGERVVLKNVFFDTDAYILKPESYVELDKLYEFLRKDANVRIELGGHTDNIGGQEHNKLLSENRAKAVFDYLATKGIPTNRMTYKGYGFERPIDSNDTESGRANNRRTEFVVLAN